MQAAIRIVTRARATGRLESAENPPVPEPAPDVARASVESAPSARLPEMGMWTGTALAMPKQTPVDPAPIAFRPPARPR